MKVSVLGSGQMGTGIASLLIQSEQVSEIIWWARSASALDKSYIRIKKEIRRFAKNSEFTQEELLGKLQPTCELSDIADSYF